MERPAEPGAATESEMSQWANDSIYSPGIIDENVTIRIRHTDQIVALAPYLAQIIWETNREFTRCKADMRSSTAIDYAVVNGFMNDMVLQLRQIWAAAHSGEHASWLETNDEKLARVSADKKSK